MDLPALLAALADPAAYPRPVNASAYPRPSEVVVRQTHLSVAFLVGDTVYKVRKPVNLGFVDFTTLDKRKHDCDEEVRLNRRLAPAVYRGVVPITMQNGRVRVDGKGEPIEWAVEMVRLPDDATLKARIARDEVTVGQIEALARRLAEFHRTAARGEHVSRFGRFDVVAGNARENFAQTAGHVGVTVRQSLYDRVRESTEKALADLKPLIESRAERGVPCDTHGDLHLSHVYLFPDRPPPDDLVIIDCIEFAERFRFADPVADLAFLVMDLQFHGRRDLAKACADAYFAAASSLESRLQPDGAGRPGAPAPPAKAGTPTAADEGRQLLPFYTAYRAVVRAKVEGMQALEAEVPEEQKIHRQLSAEQHWRLALGTLEEPLRRPALVLVGGLPGTGKSTLARGLAQAANFTLIRSDEVRKELAGIPATEKGEGLYTPEWTRRTYLECGRRTAGIIEADGRALVDATFHSGSDRAVFLTHANFLRIPAVFLVCQADPALVRHRLRARRGDASDADERVYAELAAKWTGRMPGVHERQTVEIDTTDAGRALEQALGVLRGIGLRLTCRPWTATIDTMPATLLIVDDEEAISWALRKAFERQGHKVGVAASAEAALELAEKIHPDAVILDVRLPGMDGLAALGRLREITHNAPVIVVTAHGNLSTAVRAVEGGAFDYLAKPFDLSQALDAVARALASRTRPVEEPTPTLEPGEEELVGRGPAMQGVFKRIALVAPTDASVLITGESGTGKELVARAVHRHSLRKDRPFLPVHVAALNPNLVESELFGHVKGAFTGAAAAKPGLLTLADGGTVFLDELGDVPLPVQAKLLRVLEHQEVLPVGGSVPTKIDVRVLAATHSDLLKQVNAGQFRHDLYFRLNVFEVHLPALRDRPEDIPLLCDHFLRRFGANAALSEGTAAYLRSRTWPGNVRELRNALEHAAIVARGGPLLPEQFPPPAAVGGPQTMAQQIGALVRDWVREKSQGAEPTELYDDLLKCVEPALLDEVLRQTNNNRVAASRRLGLARATLRKLIARYRAPEEVEGDEEE